MKTCLSKSYWLCSTLVFSTVIAASAALAQMEPPPPPEDMYGNGTMRGRLAERVLRDFDLNHDGKITKDELQRALAQRFREAGGGAPAISEAQFVKSHARFLIEYSGREFHKLDWNGDGVLSLDEYREGLRARFERMDKDGAGAVLCTRSSGAAAGRGKPGGDWGTRPHAGRSAGGGLGKLCQEADLNHDGRVTRDEFDKAAAGRYGAIVRGGKGMTLAQFQADQMATFQAIEARRFKRLNKNGDGKLTLAEFSAPAVKMFEKLDKNHDGVLAPDELARPSKGRHGAAPHAGPGKRTGASAHPG